MNIAFDIDGVLTDIETYQLKVGKKFFKQRKIIDERGYSIREIFGCTEKEEYVFWRKNILSYSMKWPARTGCGEMIAKIKEEGNSIFIISSRIKASSKGFVGWLMRRIVYRFFKRFEIPYDQIFFCSVQNSAEEKSRLCKDLQIDLIVEDCPENINALKDVTQVICFDSVYNKEIPNVYHVHNFYEIYEYVNKQNKNVTFKYQKRKERMQMSLDERETYFNQLCEYYKSHTDKKVIVKTEVFYKRCSLLIKPLFDLIYRYEVESNNRIELDTPTIYVANHRSMIDSLFIMSLLNHQPIHLLAKAEFLKKSSGYFLKAVGCVFVERTNKDSHILAKEQLIKVILSGGNVIIFPEGTRNKTDEILLDFKLGAVDIAQITGCPIVPIAIVWNGKDNHHDIKLKVGKRIYVSYGDDLIEKNNYLRGVVKKMLVKLD